MRAKWLTILCPADLDIAFAPYPGQQPLYHADHIKIIDKAEPGWWNHYFFNSWQIKKEKGMTWSLGPNIDPSRKLHVEIPLVVNSNYQKAILLNSWQGYPSSLITTIPNMIDHTIFKPGKKSSQITVGWIGYDHPNLSTKGVEVLPYLAKKFPDIQFEMVHGRKPKFLQKWLPQDLPNLKCYYQVPHIKLAEIIQKWHVLICGSKWETGATHVKEAMACGVPVIAARVGTLPEIASSQILLPQMKWYPSSTDQDWLTWSTESLERFGQALSELLQNHKSYHSYVQAALEESKQAFPQVIAQKWFEFMYKCRDYHNSC